MVTYDVVVHGELWSYYDDVHMVLLVLIYDHVGLIGA
jgi:hypothetical protein